MLYRLQIPHLALMLYALFPLTVCWNTVVIPINKEEVLRIVFMFPVL